MPEINGFSEKNLRVYLDNCVFNRPFDDQTSISIKLESDAKLYIQEEIYKGKLELVWSFILEYENNQSPYQEKKETILKWKKLSKLFVEPSEGVKDLALQYEIDGIKSKDALHLACAIFAQADFLITTDHKFKSKAKEIKHLQVVSPIDFIMGYQGEKNV